MVETTTRPTFIDQLPVRWRVLILLQQVAPRHLHLDEIRARLPSFNNGAIRMALSRAKKEGQAYKDAEGLWALVEEVT